MYVMNVQQKNGAKKLHSKNAPNIEVSIKTITPKIARILLDRTDSSIQRKQNRSQINFLAKEMQSKNFQFNGDAIREDKHGNIIDGQHRLMACIETNIPFETIYVKGLETEQINTIDTGAKSRSYADVLEIAHGRKYKYATAISASVKLIHKMENGQFNQSLKNHKYFLSSTDFLKWCDQNVWIFDHVENCCRSYWHSDKLLNQTILISVKWFLDKFNRDESEKFFHKIMFGSLTNDCSIYYYRRKLTKMIIDQVKWSTRDHIFILLRVWNAYMDNEVLTKFNIPKKMPVIKSVKKD